LGLVAAGLGISLAPSHSADRHLGLAICDISGIKLERILGLTYKTEHPFPFELLTTVDNFKEHFESSR
jgi:LysR family transcriptional regulator, benzoate and cis,cis-muconate-responsive activator of ben and cat genes